LVTGGIGSPEAGNVAVSAVEKNVKRVCRFVVKADHLEDLVRLGTLTRGVARFLAASVVAGLNILVAGGTRAGKTTMLNCLSSVIPSRERVVTSEEVFELANPG